MVKFKFGTFENDINAVINKVKNDINILETDYQNEVEQFLVKLNELSKKSTLEVAFVGQYSAGKSTIIYALTKNQHIKIGQDITTDKATAYKWGSVQLIDTPGIYAGRPDHDKISLEYIDHADLLVYVITTQGFIPETAKNFRKLAFDEKRIDKMMLVINKSSQGNKEEALQNWIDDALMVIDPKTKEGVYLSVIDAKSYVEGLHTDNTEEQKEWFHYSDFKLFIESLNQFIKDKGMLGRLITPLNFLETEITSFLNKASVDNEEISNLLDLLHRKQFRIKKSKGSLEEVIDSKLISLVNDIEKEGDSIANLIEIGSDKETIEKADTLSNEQIKEYCLDTTTAIENAIENEMANLYEELQILIESDLALSLYKNNNFRLSSEIDLDFKKIDIERIKNLSDILNNISKFANGFAKNPEMVKEGVKEGLKLASKSDAHKMIYNVGKIVGYKFKPYEAVKYADKIGKVGNILGKIGPALPAIAAAYDEYQEHKLDQEIKKAKSSVRSAYRSIANDIMKDYKKQFKSFLNDTYETELESINHTMSELREKFSEKNQTFIALQNDLDEINTLISTIEKQM